MGDAGKRVDRALILCAMLVLSVVVESPARAQGFSAEAVKAAFLHRFAAYIAWPPDAPTQGPFVIAVAGDEEVARHLDGLLPRMTVQGRSAELRRVTRAAELDGVHILYLGAEMPARTRDLRAAATQRPILLVTSGEGFDAGGVINFLESDSRVRFEVSLPAADRARLRIDAALLSVAARVVREPQALLRRAGRLADDPDPGCLFTRAFPAAGRKG